MIDNQKVIYKIKNKDKTFNTLHGDFLQCITINDEETEYVITNHDNISLQTFLLINNGDPITLFLTNHEDICQIGEFDGINCCKCPYRINFDDKNYFMCSKENKIKQMNAYSREIDTQKID